MRKRAIGDVLWMEPVIRAFAKKYRRVIVHSKYNELFQNYPFKNVQFKSELTFFEKVLIRIERFFGTHFFSIELDNAYEKTPKMHLLSAYQLKASLPVTQEYPHLYLTDAEKANNRFLNRYAVLHMESFSERNYRTVHGVNWESVVDYLGTIGIQTIEIGTKEKTVKNAMFVKTSIRELIALVYNSTMFIGCDSGPSHIAASLGVKSLIFFGAVNPEYRHFSKLFNGLFLQQPCEFSGCYHEVSGNIKGPSCRLVGDIGIPKCSLHTTENVITKIDTILKRDASKNL